LIDNDGNIIVNTKTLKTDMAAALSDKAQQILLVTQTLVQENGYNGFSFRDVAQQVGIKSASIHYHFPTKNGLVQAATQQYRLSFNQLLEDIEGQNTSAPQQLEQYAVLFQNTLKQQRMCLCGILASEVDSLPDEVKQEIDIFFNDQTRWLERVIAQGQKTGTINPALNAADLAFSYLSTLEGAMVVAKSQNKPSRLAKTAQQFIGLIRLP
jgi:TetR/AcrR family transcriptional repressor of nem operon